MPTSVVLVHGLGSSCHIWDLVAPRLADRGLGVVALDQRGHGESNQPDTGYDFASIVSDLSGLVESKEIRRGEQLVLVGHSWGASVVLSFAVQHPDRAAGIALVDGGISSPGEAWSWAETESRLRPPDVDGLRWDELRERMARSSATYADPRAEAVGRSLFRIDSEGRIARRFRISNHMQVVRALWSERPAELLPRVQCPMLILPARQPSDPSGMLERKTAAVDRALALQPQARVRWFDDTIHDVPLQRPVELAMELLGFVGEVQPTLARH